MLGNDYILDRFCLHKNKANPKENAIPLNPTPKEH